MTVTEERPRPLCECGRGVKRHRKNKLGFSIWRTQCYICCGAADEARRWKLHNRYGGYRKLDHCEVCFFKAADPCQLDIDHINGEHADNTPGNHMTMCANCHRIKTKREKNGTYSKQPPLQVV